MKYKVGDLVFLKDFRPRRAPPHLRLRLRLRPELYNTYGIITKAEKHTDIFKKGSTEDDDSYVWLSQVDGKEYHFYEDEVLGEVVK